MTDTGTDPTETAALNPDTDDSASPRSNEAAKYRLRLRDTEADRDRITAQLTTARDRLAARDRRDVHDLAAATLTDPEDLHRLGGLDLDDLPKTDTDELDLDAIRAAVDTLAAGRPELTRDGAARASRRLGPPATGQGDRGTAPTGGPAWADILRR